MTPDLPIGATCQFFLQADRNATPLAAIVVNSNGQGVLQLIAFGQNGGEQLRKAVRHISDPMLEERRVLAIQHGAWDYVPMGPAFITIREPVDMGAVCGPLGVAPPINTSEWLPPPANAVEASIEEVEADVLKVLEMHEQNLSEKAIANSMGKGWTVSRVKSVVAKHGS